MIGFYDQEFSIHYVRTRLESFEKALAQLCTHGVPANSSVICFSLPLSLRENDFCQTIQHVCRQINKTRKMEQTEMTESAYESCLGTSFIPRSPRKHVVNTFLYTWFAWRNQAICIPLSIHPTLLVNTSTGSKCHWRCLSVWSTLSKLGIYKFTCPASAITQTGQGLPFSPFILAGKCRWEDCDQTSHMLFYQFIQDAMLSYG